MMQVNQPRRRRASCLERTEDVLYQSTVSSVA